MCEHFLYISDAYFLHEGSPTYIDDLVNFEKMVRVVLLRQYCLPMLAHSDWSLPR